MLRPKAEEGAELEVDKTGFAFARKRRELKCDLTEEQWGCAALQEHGVAKGEAFSCKSFLFITN